MAGLAHEIAMKGTELPIWIGRPLFAHLFLPFWLMKMLTESFPDLDDPREDGNVRYPLTSVLVIAVCAAIAGAENYEDIVLYGKSKSVYERPGKWS